MAALSSEMYISGQKIQEKNNLSYSKINSTIIKSQIIISLISLISIESFIICPCIRFDISMHNLVTLINVIHVYQSFFFFLGGGGGGIQPDGHKFF